VGLTEAQADRLDVEWVHGENVDQLPVTMLHLETGIWRGPLEFVGRYGELDKFARELGKVYRRQDCPYW
jgi:hypothetical protein